jgi:hypothetical protein
MKAVNLNKKPLSSNSKDPDLVAAGLDWNCRFLIYFSTEHRVRRPKHISVEISPQTVYFS